MAWSMHGRHESGRHSRRAAERVPARRWDPTSRVQTAGAALVHAPRASELLEDDAEATPHAADHAKR